MRGKLLGTTALMAASVLAASPAAAQGIKLGIGGFMHNFMGFGDVDGNDAASDDDFNPTNFFSEGEVWFEGEFTADNGITFGANIQLESFQSDPDQIDENYGYAEGGFGRLVFGSENTAAYLMQFAAPEAGIAINSGWVTDFIPDPGIAGYDRSVGGSTFVDIGNDENRLTYFTPRFFGFQFGASYTPTISGSGAGGGSTGISGDGENTPANEDTETRNGISLGANYVQTFGGFDIAIAGGFQTAERGDEVSGGNGQPKEDIYTYSTGANVSFAGFTVGGSGAVVTGGSSDAGRAFDAGVSYEIGPWTAAANYFNGMSRGTTGRNEGMQAINFGVDYALAPGVTLSGSVLYAELEGADGSTDVNDWGEREGVVGALGISFRF